LSAEEKGKALPLLVSEGKKKGKEGERAVHVGETEKAGKWTTGRDTLSIAICGLRKTGRGKKKKKKAVEQLIAKG